MKEAVLFFHRLLLCTIFCWISVAANAQENERVISGKVTDAEGGEPLPGVNIVIQGSNIGTITDLDGNYNISVTDEDVVLIFSFIGYATQNIRVGNLDVINVQLSPDVQSLEEVVVTGVAGSLSKDKLSFTVASIDEDIIQQVPAVNPGRALQGKVAGVRVSGSSGAPGSSPDIQLRGATTIFGSSNPLIIVDGILTEGSLNDINTEDIASIEVVKGAAASSLYGSRAANGVVNIITKRGSGLAAGSSNFSYRTEVGQSFIGYVPEKSTSTNFLVEDGEVLYGQPSPDGIADNPYPSLTDPVDQFFNPGFYFTNHLSFRANGPEGKTSLYSSLQHTSETGVVDITDGQDRLNLRINIDHYFNDKLKFTTSNLYSQSDIDQRANGIWDLFYYADPNADFLAPNDDGTHYKVDPNRLGMHENPLYLINNTINTQERYRFLGHYAINYSILDFLDLKLAYGLDRINIDSRALTPKGKLRVNNEPDLGGISLSTSNTFAQTLQGDVFFHRSFGDFNARVNLQYLYESNEFNSSSGSGSQLAVRGMDVFNLDLADQETISNSSYSSLIVANNVSGMLYLDYKEKFIFDGLIRRDGVSLFGANERWQTFYRLSGAYRITEDFNVPGMDELKVRASYGVAGLRPPFEAQYEVFGISNGDLTSPITIGNEDLKPSFSKEIEIGVDARFLERFSFTANYAKSRNTDQILNVPVSAGTGFATRWENAGILEATALEFSLGADLIRSDNFNWSANLLWDRIRQDVVSLERPGYAIISGGIFRIEEGEVFGTLYGHQWARNLEAVANQVPEGEVLEEYFVLNNEGYVVRTTDIGTTNEIPVKVRDDTGNPIETKIGDINPDFNVNFSSTMNYKNFNLFFLMGWQQGGDIYNHMRRYMLVHNVGAQLDQSNKPKNEQKSARYYTELTGWNNSHFVEDATFLKLREVALSYTFKNGIFNRVGIDNIKLGVVGRNLLTFTKYSGFNPEAGRSEEGLDSNVFKFDISSYPFYSTISGTLSLTF